MFAFHISFQTLNLCHAFEMKTEVLLEKSGTSSDLQHYSVDYTLLDYK